MNKAAAASIPPKETIIPYPEFQTEKIVSYSSSGAGERKHITILFSDLSGYTTMIERMDPEEVREITDLIFGNIAQIMEKHGGVIERVIGDEILVFFGVPKVHEYDAVRAIRAASDIHNALQSMDKKFGKQIGHPIKMHIGIDTGLVVTGSTDIKKGQNGFAGQSINVASYLTKIAGPGETLVGYNTFQSAEGYFIFERLKYKKKKGLEEPIDAYRVIAPSLKRTRFDVNLEQGLTPFVGRQQELAFLLDRFEMCKAGRGQAFSIVSEAGLGKSRLLYEFRKAVGNEPVTFLEGKCLSYSRDLSYNPLIDILKANFDIREDDPDSEIIEKIKRGLNLLSIDERSNLPFILRILSVEEAGCDQISMDSSRWKNRIVEILKQIAFRGSENRPLILAIEDLQWIDKSSEEVLKAFLNSISAARIFLIFTYRPEFAPGWGKMVHSSHVTLYQLSNRECLLMTAHLLGTKNIDSILKELILEKTEGVPFYVEEFIKYFKDLKVIEKKDQSYCIAKDVSSVTIPTQIQDVIMARVDSIPEEGKGLLQIGSVAGREFSFDLIKSLLNFQDEKLRSYLSLLKDSELLYERRQYPQTFYIFKHALTQEVIYNGLLFKNRKKIHEKIAKTMENLYSESLNDFCEVLAYHFSKSDNLSKAYFYLKLWGQKAMHRYSFWEALHSLKKAILILNQMPADRKNRKEQINALLLISECLYPLSYPEDSLKILQEGKKLSMATGDDANVANFHRKIGFCYGAKGKHYLAIEYLEKSLREANKIHDFGLAAQVSAELCVSYARVAKHFQVAEIAPKILSLYKKAENRSTINDLTVVPLSRICSIYGLSLGMMGDFVQGIRFCEKGVITATETGDFINLVTSEWHFGYVYVFKGDGKRAIGHLKNAIKNCEQGQCDWMLGWALSLLGYAYFLLGDTATAVQKAEKGLRIQNNAEFEVFSSLLNWVLGVIYSDLGDMSNAMAFIKKALELAQKNQEAAYEGLSWIWLGKILGKTDSMQTVKAENCFIFGINKLEKLKLKTYYSQGYLFLGEFYYELGQTARALEYIQKAATLFQKMGMDFWFARTQAALKKMN